MKAILIIVILISTAFAHEDEYKFRPDYWSKGLHLIAGGGVNGTYYDSNESYGNYGYGLNGKTDLGYYFTNRFAVEWSSNVKFNKINDYLVWDTLITFGLRYRLKEYYIRGFGGKAPTVIFFQGNPPDEYKNSSASRLQYDGPVYGLAIGKMYEDRNGLIWFLETSATFQELNDRQGIKMNGQTPVVVSRERDASRLYSLYFMIGLLVF
jgi:hypothetical protein